ncbi:MAG: DUF1552 domain-containing protein [Candidatus Solibacter usitatus]|nr:DUF1552 domain-containing protein [Candidatus Solibacter usitatus]
MIITGKTLNRRWMLRGMGAAIGLPFLDAMVPAMASAASQGKPPLRAAWVYVPNGVIMSDFTPPKDGPLTTFPRILKPVERHKDDLLVLSNLTQNYGRALLDGPGDHGRAAANYLTGVHVYKTAGADIKLSVSVDQMAAKQVGAQTKLPSLEIGMDDGRQAGNCDSGYSCAYTNNLAWRSETQPLPAISDPRGIFERLFGAHTSETPAARARRLQMKQSIIDLVTDDTKKLQTNLGTTDKRKLDEYLYSVREIEKSIQRAEKENADVDPKMDKPYGVPADFGDYFRLMADMVAVAFQADLTRIVTMMVGREGSQRTYREIGIADSHHNLTHHQNDASMIDKVAQINTYHVDLFAQFVDRMKASKEGTATVLDNSMLMYGGGLSDGNGHTHHHLPLLVAGRAGGAFKPGRHITYRKETPLNNYYVTLLGHMGMNTEHFGDSTGKLDGLSI